MPARTYLAAVPLVLLGTAVGLADTIHRNGFAGRETFWVRADANVAFQELAHRISDEHCKNAPTSEYIKIEANPPPGSIDEEWVHYAYTIPPAPVTDRLTAGVWVKAYRANSPGGIQVKARLVLPKEQDPNNPTAPLTAVIKGEVYRNVRQWQPLTLGNVQELVRRQLPILHAQLGRAVNPSDAYIDRILLNVYAGPGTTEVWIDDLEVGPVRQDLAPPTVGPPAGVKGAVPKSPIADLPTAAPPRAKAVKFSGGQITVDDNPFFMLAIRHTDTPLKTLRDAQFNTIWFPGEVPPEAVEEAIRHGFWIMPSVPIPPSPVGPGGMPGTPTSEATAKDADEVGRFLRRFLSGDAVLMWDLGSGRTAEDARRVKQAAEVIASYDPGRPRAIDLWDGFPVFTRHAEAMGTHRWPLFTSLEMSAYKTWLVQRQTLYPLGKLNWTWVQTHLPDWFVTLLAGRPDVESFDDPVGPHPEQIRILTYLSLAAGCRGLGFWSDRFLANSHHGRDRLLELALLNAEIEMLKPILLKSQGSEQWIGTSDPNVQAAVFRTQDPRTPAEVLVLPVWLGGGTQFCPPQGTLSNLTIKVQNVPDLATPWLVTPAGITELKGARRVAGGTEITIPEFDLTAAVVFTSDLGLDGKIVRWQDHTRYRIGELAAGWAHQQAVEQYNKTLATHKRICEAGGPVIDDADLLLARSRKAVDTAREFLDNRQWDAAYREARRAQRPLRVLMREHWRKATETLDTPTASPYAVSFYSLPLHWVMAREVQASKPYGNALVHGAFELSAKAPPEGAAVTSLPRWSVRRSTLDPGVKAVAAILNSAKLVDPPPPQLPRVPLRYNADRVGYRPDEAYHRPPPELGGHCLSLSIVLPKAKDSKGNVLPPPPALERTFLAVDSEPAELAPGQLVRISFWAKVPGPIFGSADGVIVYDSAGGEPLGVRIGATAGWREFHLYRRVPANGKVSVTFALTGIGTAFFDDLRIEPLVGSVAPGTPVDPSRMGAQPVARGR